jgi:hypothetical protein
MESLIEAILRQLIELRLIVVLDHRGVLSGSYGFLLRQSLTTLLACLVPCNPNVILTTVLIMMSVVIAEWESIFLTKWIVVKLTSFINCQFASP